MGHNSKDLIAGVDNLSLDNRKFDPSRDEIEHICRFFSIGKLRHYEKEKGLIVSHTNFLVFVKTAHGQYAIKFYPTDAAKKIAIEYAINRILTDHHFLTPDMYAGLRGQPFLASNGHLAACYSYIDGRPVWKHIKQRSTIRQVNGAMLSLKNILSTGMGRIPLPKQEGLATTINSLTKNSRALAPYDQKKIIDASLLDACRTYQHHRSLFTRQCLHNNAGLTNFLIHKKTIYTLDLSHVREDYALSDLSSLVISCFFFDIPKTTINTIAKNYLTQHKKSFRNFPVINTLVKIGLVKEYLKNIQREKSVDLFSYPPDLVHTYMSLLRARKESITAVLKKMNNSPRLIV